MTGAPRGFIVDMDGVLYKGERPMPGLRDFFSLIEAHPFVLLTNNSTVSAIDCEAKLGRMGVEVPAAAILTVVDATCRYLAAMLPTGGRAFVLGSCALNEAARHAGFELVPAGSPADVVVIGLDTAFTYAALSHAVRLVADGAAFVTTSLDPVLLTEDGALPGAGALAAAVSACVDAQPVCVGKPSALMFETAAAQLGVPPEDILVVGDNLVSDIGGGVALGARTALLLSGVTGSADGIEGAIRPDFVFPGLPELSTFLRRSW